MQFVADKRITLEVCLTSNQQTVPELAADLSKHPFAEMRKRKLRRLLHGQPPGFEHHGDPGDRPGRGGLRSHRTGSSRFPHHGVKRSFFLEKRQYVRRCDRLMKRVWLGQDRKRLIEKGPRAPARQAQAPTATPARGHQPIVKPGPGVLFGPGDEGEVALDDEGQENQFVGGEVHRDAVLFRAQDHFVQLVPEGLAGGLLLVGDELILRGGDLCRKASSRWFRMNSFDVM